MFRFVGLVWDTSNHQQSDAAQLLGSRLRNISPQWRDTFHRDGLSILCADARAGSMESLALADNSGVVLGALFERHSDGEDDTPSRRAAPGARETEAIRKSHGRWLIDHCWGNYVAFILDTHARRVSVVKDPTGSLPCFSTVFRGVTIFFSCVADCVRLNLLSFNVNRAWLEARVAGSGATLQCGALDEVSQVHRGECVQISPADPMPIVARQLYWNPMHFPDADDLIEDSDRAARSARATVRACAHSWAGGHQSLVHRLSGGLDSSIIIGCLADAPTRPRIICYTYYNPGGRSDERPWARLAASRAGCELRECAVTPAGIGLAAALRMQSSVEPTSVMGYLQRIALEQPLAADRGATAVFSGDGGDSGFCSDSIADVVPEFLRTHGLGPAAFRLASQVALCSGQSTWTVLYRALRPQLVPAARSEQRERPLTACRLVNPEILESSTPDDCCAHPWFSGADVIDSAGFNSAAGIGSTTVRRASSAVGTSSTTVRRMGTLLCTPDFYSGCEPEGLLPDVVAPLYAQPVIELLLRIPLYRHFENGRDRGLARRAFAADVPEPILRRLWKDRAPRFYDELVDRNRLFLREVLLDGVLVKEGLLNRSAVEAALSATFSRSGVLPGEIFKHLDVELWARRWAQAGRCRAAA